MTTVLYPRSVQNTKLSTRKNPQWRFHIPAGLDLSGLAPDLHEYAYYFVSLLIRRRIFDARLKFEEYVPLQKKYLQKFVPWHDLQTVLTFLIDDTQQIECDGFYSIKELTGVGKCYGYKLSDRLESSTVSLRYAESFVLRKKLSSEWADFKSRQRPVHKHLNKWLNKVEIDAPAARAAIEELCSQPLKYHFPKKGGERLANNVRRRQRRIQAEAAVLDLSTKMERRFEPDDYGRCHSIITNLPSLLRRTLRIDGQPFVCLDLRNSQPLILAVLLSERRRSLLTSVSLKIDSGSTHSQVPLRSKIHCKTLLEQDLQEYSTACEQGVLYECMAGYDLSDYHVRSKFKQAFFQHVLFGDGIRRSIWTKRFQERFPTVWTIIQEIKAKDYRHLSHNLQKLESTIIFAICDNLRQDRPEIPLVTIHDSILTTQEHVQVVRTYMMAEFARYGFTPSLTQETYE